MRIALLEDDRDQAELIRLWLTGAGDECECFAEGEGFMQGLEDGGYDLAILDWMLPDTSGIEVLNWIREQRGWDLPVIFVTARDTEADIVEALKNGADDYMTKPVKQMELLARLGAVARRARPVEEAAAPNDDRIEIGPFLIDRAERSVTRGEDTFVLTQKEFDLAMYLLQNIGRLMSRGHILEKVWGRSAEINTRTVDTHISRLRNKLSLTPENGWRLSAIYQHGYRLERLEDDVGPVASEG